MKEIFDWMREMIEDNSANGFMNDGACFSYIPSILAKNIVTLAEQKWEEECCEWAFMEGVEDCRCGCNGYHVDYMVATKYNFCPYCGKPIKISEVE